MITPLTRDKSRHGNELHTYECFGLDHSINIEVETWLVSI